ncbi:VanW family protein [Nonomuraea sp. NPDC050310]|uniref:VanW family protein n=1 Tax=Nonomuraea sp. NPDC050310 TaxID=3154935 RepID=UPI0034081634
MRNAGPIESSTDPFSAVPLPEAAPLRRPRIEGLPPGVLPDLSPEMEAQVRLPAVAQPPQPWPLAMEQVKEPPPPPAPVFGLVPQRESSARRPAAPPPASRAGRRLLKIVLGLALLLATAYLVPAIIMAGTILPGTRVSGIDIGGLTVTDAADKVLTELRSTVERPILIEIDGRQKPLPPEAAGVTLDVVATINQAPSGFPSPAQVWRGLTGVTELQPRISIDGSQLARSIESLAQSVDRQQREGEVAFRGLTPVATLPREGVLLDREESARLIREALIADRGTVVLPVKLARPTTSANEVRQATELARRAVAAPIVLTHAGRQAVLTPEVLAARLTFGPDGKGDLAPKFETRGAAIDLAESTLITAAQAPRDAGYDVVGSRLVPVRARVGRGLDRTKLAADVARVVSRGGPRTIEVSLATARPRVTDEMLAGLGIETQVGSSTIPFDCCAARVTNIRRMAEQLDGYLVKPGETFSLKEVVGEPTPAAGYVPAPQYVEGRVTTIMGGGGSQVATTMLNAAYRAGFEIVEQHPFDIYMKPYPRGLDTMFRHPGLDLRWRNDSEHGVLIKTASTPTSVTVTLYSTKRYDQVEVIVSDERDVIAFPIETSTSPGCTPLDGVPGFTVDVTRVFRDDGREVRRDRKLTTQYRPRPQVVCTVMGRG